MGQLPGALDWTLSCVARTPIGNQREGLRVWCTAVLSACGNTRNEQCRYDTWHKARADQGRLEGVRAGQSQGGKVPGEVPGKAGQLQLVCYTEALGIVLTS